MDDDAGTLRRQAREGRPGRGAAPLLAGLSDFFPQELRCANCGARFVTRVRDGATVRVRDGATVRVRDGATVRVRDGANLCPVCFSALAEAARSRSLLARRRCA